MREPLTIVELEVDQCRLMYGESPCSAVLGTTGVRKCYNTRSTCQDPTNYDSSPADVDSVSTPQDVANAGSQEASFDVTTEEAIPSDLTFSRDGTKLYIVGQDSDQVRQYPLSTPWEIGSAGAVEASKSVATEDNTPQAVKFKTDGMKMYIVGTQNDQVRQYPLTTAWDISTAGAVEASKSVAGEDTSPQGLAFKDDGSKMYICGGTSDSIHQYALATEWDISTAGSVEESFDVGAVIEPQGFVFGSQGTKLYIIGSTLDRVRQHTLSTAWDLSTVGDVESSFGFSSWENFGSGVALSREGTKLYIVGTSGFVRQFSIAGAIGGIVVDATGVGDIDTVGAVEETEDVNSEDTNPQGLFISPDGLKLFIVGTSSLEVHQYSLSVAWDLSSISAVEESFDVSNEDNNPRSLTFSVEGDKLYITGQTAGEVFQYPLATAWDLSTAGAVEESFDVSVEETSPAGIFFKSDGLQMYITGIQSDQVHQYTLSVAWDVSTAVYAATLDSSGEDTAPVDVFLRDDGRKVYVLGETGDEVHQYPLATAWDLSSAGVVESQRDLGTEDTTPQGIFFKEDRTKLYMTGSDGEIHQYPIELAEGNIDGAVHTSSDIGTFSQEMTFDGVDDSVEVFDTNDNYGYSGTNSFTVEFLINPTSIPTTFTRIVSKEWEDGSGTQGWRIRLRASDTNLVFERLLNGAADTVAASVTLGKSTFWSAVYDGTDIILYEEGLEVGRTTSSKSITENGQSLTVGNTYFGETDEPYIGSIDELRIWSAARTQTEIQERMVLPISGQEVGLASYFPFDKEPRGVATRILRFTKPQTSAPRGTYLIPLLTGVDSAPTRLNPGGGSRDRGVLGDRASVDISFKDGAGSDRVVDKYRAERIDGTAQTDESGYEPLDRGSFWSKWVKRNLYFQNRRIRVLEGYVGEELHEMQSREYFIDRMRGPDSDGRVVIRAKDVLKLADDERAQVPPATPGELSANLTDAETTSFQATGALVSDYPSEPGLVRINDEIIAYTTRTQATADNVQFNTLTRGERGTTAAAHSEEDRVQRCVEYVDQFPWDIAEDLLTTFGNVPSEFIPSSDWEDEGQVWLVQYVISAILSEPTSVTQLLSEITQQTQFFIWWDEYSQTIKLRALRPPIDDPTELNDTSHIVENSSTLMDHPDRRLSQIWVFFNQKDPTKDLEDESNYSRLRIRADLEAESDTQYGESRILKIFSRWLQTEGQVIQVAKRTLDRYRDNPVTLKLKVDAKDRDSVRAADLCDITTRTVVDERGVEVPTRWQVISSHENPPGEAVSLEMQKSEFSGNFAFYMEDDAPDFSAATESEKKSGAWYAEDDGTMGAGNGDGYQIQ